jgi:NHLM bacteriocin system ABC transporter peptidase/ATP-binding protein
VPTILQLEAVECGAAAVAMVLGYYRRRLPLEEVRAACGVSRDGSKASNMLKAARRYGLVAKGFRKEPEQLKSMPLPMIIHWNFNHFVVLEGFGRNTVYLNDPAQGPTRVSEGELDESFTGVALTFEPGPDFQPGGRARSLYGALAPRLAGSRLGLLFVFLTGFALLIPGLLVPTFSQVFIDDILIRGLKSWLRPLLIAMGLTALVTLALAWLQQRYLQRLETKLSLVTSCKFFWHVLRLPIEFFNQRYAGEVASRVGLNDKVATLLSGELATTLLNFAVIIFYAGLMFQYDVILSAVSVTIAVLNMLALHLVSRKRVDLNQRLLKDRGTLMGVAMGGLQTIETLKASGAESAFFSRWAGYHAKVVNSGQDLAVATQVLSLVPALLLSINTAVLLGLGGLRVIEGHLSMGMLMTFQALMLAFINPVNRMVSLGGKLQEAKGDLNRLDDILQAELDDVHVDDDDDEETSRETAASPPPGASVVDRRQSGDGDVKLAGFLELRGVEFGYSRLEKPLITDFNLRLTPGSRVALVGGSGSGKSTIARLVAGLYKPWAGEILFDGKTRSEIPRRVITNSLALVDQEIFLFEGTVRDNLALWDETLSEEVIVEAAKDASILKEVAARKNGFASLVDEGGANFSGGQRQRLEIARALAGSPTILVLDEATSALDPTTEKIIDDNLRRLGLTCLIVAHRLSTIRDCDEIIVMECGSIVQRGTHEKLMSNAGLYQHLLAAE